jgi:hypothetical protein
VQTVRQQNATQKHCYPIVAAFGGFCCPISASLPIQHPCSAACMYATTPPPHLLQPTAARCVSSYPQTPALANRSGDISFFNSSLHRYIYTGRAKVRVGHDRCLRRAEDPPNGSQVHRSASAENWRKTKRKKGCHDVRMRALVAATKQLLQRLMQRECRSRVAFARNVSLLLQVCSLNSSGKTLVFDATI